MLSWWRKSLRVVRKACLMVERYYVPYEQKALPQWGRLHAGVREREKRGGNELGGKKTRRWMEYYEREERRV